MKDALLRFDTEADAITALSEWNSEGSWRGDCTIPNVIVTDSRTGQMSGWFIILEGDLELYLSSMPECILIANRDLAAVNNPNFILYSSIPSDELNFYTVSPTPFGSSYPFGTV